MAATQTFSNSPLIVYTKLSPNHSGRRTQNIDRITPHCVVGQLSCETICDCFPAGRGASCNYGIGTDGRRSLCVEEKNRSWCTSSNANDQRAVTIECASDKSSPYSMNAKVYNSLVELCTDICRRNGKKKLLWLGDKTKTLNYSPKSDEMVLTVHRWFANKSCPGDWLYKNLGDLASKVTAALGGGQSTPPNQDTNIIAGSTEKIIWNFLKGKGLNDYAVAGIMGNLYAESALQASNLQNTYEKKLGYTDAAYTAAVDSGKYNNFVRDSAGYGLAQWTFWSRKEGLLNYAKKTGKSIGDTTMQLEFLWTEMQSSTYKKMMATLKSATSVRQASDVFLLDFERPANQSESVKVKRAEYGMSYYKKNADGDKSNFPYRVKVNDATVLNIRKGPGTNYAVAGQIRDNGVYTILEESTGKGAKKWGKLRSGAGWISLDYCIKLS